jgi:hypothetical protein
MRVLELPQLLKGVHRKGCAAADDDRQSNGGVEESG